MSRNIRVDAEVYAFLQQRARPFADTPNTVLRRLIGLDPSNADGQGDERVVHLTSAQKAALAVLRTDVEVNVGEVAEAAGIGRSTATSALTALERTGLAHRRRPTPGTNRGRGRISDQWRLAHHDPAPPDRPRPQQR